MRMITRMSRCAALVRCGLVLFMVALSLVMVGFLRAQAATIVVGENCSPVNAVASANADSSVGGCTAGSGPDTIVLSNTTYVYTSPTLAYTVFPILSSITISGNGATIQRDLSFTCALGQNSPSFNFFGVVVTGTLTLDNVTLQNGCMEGGGAITTFGPLTINNSRIMSNTGILGGAVYAPGSVVTVRNSSFVSNTAFLLGGALFFTEGTIENSDFYSNTAQHNSAFVNGGEGAGGALALYGPADKYLLSNRFHHNYSNGDGAAIYVIGRARMDNNLVAANKVISGGVSADIAVGSLNNISASKLYGSHNTLVARPGTEATAIVAGLDFTGTQIFLTDTILSGYETGLVTVDDGEIVANGLLWDDTAVPTQTVSGAITVSNAFVGNAAFVDPAVGDYRLSEASEAIDRGVSNLPSTDFEGDPRPVGARADLGYDEYSPLASIAVTKTVGTDAGSCASTTSLTVDAGNPVYYCITVFNNGEATFTGHTLTDARLGVQAILSYNLAPGETVQFTRNLISALGPVTLTESLTNTVFVTSTNVLGPDARAAGVMLVPATASDSAEAVVIVEPAPPTDDKQLLLPKLERQ